MNMCECCIYVLQFAVVLIKLRGYLFSVYVYSVYGTVFLFSQFLCRTFCGRKDFLVLHHIPSNLLCVCAWWEGLCLSCICLLA